MLLKTTKVLRVVLLFSLAHLLLHENDDGEDENENERAVLPNADTPFR